MDEHLLALFKGLLDDPSIQARLQHIVRTAQQTAAPASSSLPTMTKPQEEQSGASRTSSWLPRWGGDERTSQLERRVSDLEAQVRQAQREAAGYRRQLDEAKSQAQTVQEQCKQALAAKEATIQSLQTERDSARQSQADAEQRVTDAERCAQSAEHKLRNVQLEWKEQRRAYECYQKLSPQFQFSLEGVFHGRDFWTFLVNGVQRDNLSRFLEVCHHEIMIGHEDDVEAMNELFDFFFNTINDALSSSPCMGRQEVMVGDRFDPTQHIAAPGSRNSGHIIRILLPGIVIVATGKLKQPAIVQVG